MTTPTTPETSTPAPVNRGGRPRLAVTKTAISLRLDPDVLDAFRATGDGWQTRMHDVLKAWARRNARRARRRVGRHK